MIDQSAALIRIHVINDLTMWFFFAQLIDWSNQGDIVVVKLTFNYVNGYDD